MHKIQIGQHAIDRAMARRGRVHIHDRIDPTRSALLVVDMQNCFVAPGMPAEIAHARDIVPNINRLAAAFRQTGGRVVWIRNTLTDEVRDAWSVWTNDFMTDTLREAMYREMAPGSEGHQLYPALDVSPADDQIEKTRFSAFIQGSSGLHDHLQSLGIDTVVVTGTATQVCCESTARDAMMLNYTTLFVSDANAAPTDADHNGTLTALLQSFCDIQSTDQVTAALGATVQVAAE